MEVTKVERVVDVNVYSSVAAEPVEVVAKPVESSLNVVVVLAGGRGSAGWSSDSVGTGRGITETVAVKVTRVVGSEGLVTLEGEVTAVVESERDAEVTSCDTADVDRARSVEVESRTSDVNSTTSGVVVDEGSSTVVI